MIYISIGLTLSKFQDLIFKHADNEHDDCIYIIQLKENNLTDADFYFDNLFHGIPMLEYLEYDGTGIITENRIPVII